MNGVNELKTGISILFASSIIAAESPDSTYNLSREVAEILYNMGKQGLVTVKETGNERVMSFNFNPTLISIDDFSMYNLESVTLVDKGKEGPSGDDTLLTRMTFLNKQKNNMRVSIDYKNFGLTDSITSRSLNMPTPYDKMEYLNGDQPTVTKEKHDHVMAHIKYKLQKHQRKGKK